MSKDDIYFFQRWQWIVTDVKKRKERKKTIIRMIWLFWLISRLKYQKEIFRRQLFGVTQTYCKALVPCLWTQCCLGYKIKFVVNHKAILEEKSSAAISMWNSFSDLSHGDTHNDVTSGAILPIWSKTINKHYFIVKKFLLSLMYELMTRKFQEFSLVHKMWQVTAKATRFYEATLFQV